MTQMFAVPDVTVKPLTRKAHAAPQENAHVPFAVVELIPVPAV